MAQESTAGAGFVIHTMPHRGPGQANVVRMLEANVELMLDELVSPCSPYTGSPSGSDDEL